MNFHRIFRLRISVDRIRADRRAFAPESLEPRTMLAADVRSMIAGTTASVSAASPNVAAQSSVDASFVEWISTGLVAHPLSDQLQARLLRQLENGASRQRIAALVISSLPGRSAEIETTFEHLLNRTPTAIEQQRLLAQGSADQIALFRHVLSSREYFETRGGGTNAGFVDTLARDMLERPATEAELAEWTNVLDSGMVRRSGFVGGFLRSAVYREAAARQLALHAGSTDTAGLADQVLANWRGPHPLTTAKATVFGSDAFLRRFETPVPVTPRTAPTEWSGEWLSPQFSLGTSWNTDIPITLSEVITFGASPQGKFWIAIESLGLRIYDPSTRQSTDVSTGYVSSVAPISDTEAWLIGSPSKFSGPVYIAKILADGSLEKTADLPGGDTPTQISASPDGTVWVLGQSGTVYSYDAGSDSWLTIASGGFTISQISVGSATNIWGVGQSQGKTVVLQWTTGTGWAVDSNFDGVSSAIVAATADGFVWAVATIPTTSQMVFLKDPAASWALVPNQTPPNPIMEFAANDRNRMLGLTAKGLDIDLAILSIGLVDRPAVAWPEPTTQWALGYDAINAYFELTTTTMRADYVNATAPFDEWVHKLSGTDIPMPAGMDLNNWTTIKNQLIGEIEDVKSVNKFFEQLNDINTAVNLVNSQTLSIVESNVVLSTKQQNESTLELLIVGMFDAAVAGIVTAFSGGAATVAAIVGSGITTGIADVTQDSSPDPDTVLQQTYTDLQNTILQIFVKSGSLYASQWLAVNSDYGRLSALSDVLGTGLWAIEDGDAQSYAAAMQPAFELYYYQTLTAVKYQVVYMHDYICDKYTCPHIAPPSYVTYIRQVDDTELYDVYYVNELGGYTNPFRDAGPYPSKAFMETLGKIGSSLSVIVQSQNGWNLKTVNAHT